MKENILGATAIVGSYIASLYGGWTTSIGTLFIFMFVDYGTGLMVAIIFKKSLKTDSGGLNSTVGWKGLSKKCLILLYLLIAQRLDISMGTTYIRDSVCIAFILNELVSIVENSGLMGFPVPKIISDVIDVLKSKETETPIIK